MSIALTVTVGTTDYSFDWANQTIWVESGVTNVIAADLKQAIGDAQDDVIGMVFPPICKNFNPVVLTATSSTFLNVVLEDQWRINSFSANGFLVVGDGNVVNVNNGIDIFEINALVSFINNTSAAGVLVTGGSGVTPQDIVDIKNSIFDEAMEGSLDFRDFQLIMAAALGGKASGMATGNGVFRGPADTKDRISVTMDQNGNRTALVFDLT